MGLLQDIQTAALDSSVSVPLPDLLRKCMVLAKRLKHGEFEKWVSHELNGYPDDDSLPSYRVIAGAVLLGNYVRGDGGQMKNAPIPLRGLPEPIREKLAKLRFRDPVGQLTALVSGPTVESGALSMKLPADIVMYLSQHHNVYDGELLDARRVIGPAVISGILDTIRTRILEFVLAIEAENPDAGDVAPTPKSASGPIPSQTINNVFNTTIMGGQANVGTGGDASISGSNVATIGNTGALKDEKVKKLLAKLRSAAEESDHEDKIEAIEQVKKVETQLAKPKPDLDRIQQYLAIYGTIVTTVAPTVQSLIDYIPQLVQTLGLG